MVSRIQSMCQLLDFRYLLPVSSFLIILFSKGISKMLDLKNKKITNLCLFVVSLIIIINIIMSLNLAFYFANSGNTHLMGYKYAQKSSQNGIIYTHWPFDYSHLRERFTIFANIRGKLIIVHINRLIQIPLFLEVHYWGVVIFFKRTITQTLIFIQSRQNRFT